MVLESVLESPKPTYKPTERSDRLFGFGANITQLSKDVRKVLTQGWYEFDAKNMHLAIVAAQWGAKEMHKYLSSSKNSFWKMILEYLKVPYSDDNKWLIKKHVYGLVYGASKRNLIAGNDEIPGLNPSFSKWNDKAGEMFFNHPLIKDLYEAREEYYQICLNQGFVMDVYGAIHQVTRQNLRSKVSRVSQSVEQFLIYSIYELTNQTDDFSIMLNQHDGVSIKFHDEKTKRFWIENICEVFNKKAAGLNIPTFLEYELNEVKDEVKSMSVLS